MDFIKHNGDDDSEEAGAEDQPVFVEDYCSSEDEGVIELSGQKHHSSSKQVARLCRESSPPLILAFSVSSGRGLQESSPSPASSPALQQEREEENEDGDHTIEEWMILGGEEQVGDSSIQLNLDYWNSSDDDSGDEGIFTNTLFQLKQGRLRILTILKNTKSRTAWLWVEKKIFFFIKIADWLTE